jgi:hypothetical protein
MKRVKIILLLAFITLLFSLDAKSQCPQGWSYTSIQFGPEPYTGCYYQVEFCYLCHLVVGNPAGTLKVLSIKPIHTPPNPPGCIAPDRDWLLTKIWDQYFNFCTVPPCSTGYLLTIIEYPVCFKWFTNGSYYNGQYHYYSWLEACNSVNGYCQVTRKVCLDNQTGLVISYPGDPVIHYQLYNLSCQTTPIPEPTQFNPDFDYTKETSSCFQYVNCP